MGNRMFMREHCSVFSYGGDTGLLIKLGEGTVSVEAGELENKALKDEWRKFRYGEKSVTVEIDQACEDDDATDWLSSVGTFGPLVITTATKTVEGSFGCSTGADTLGDAIRSRATLKNNGEVIIQ